MPELPEAKRKRYESLGLSAYDANVMVEQMETALFYDEVLKLGADYRTANNLLVGDITAYLKENNIDLTVVGPEVPLVNGIVDEFEKEGLKIFGPNKECSTFEGSKSFSKDFMIRHNIPTAKYKEYTNLDEAISEIDSFGYPVVIKADGLAAGKVL